MKPLAHRHLIVHPEATWHDVPDLPKAACVLLDKEYVRSTSVVEKEQKSSDGSTCKLLVRLQDGMQVEAVVMTYDKEGVAFMHLFYSAWYPVLLRAFFVRVHRNQNQPVASGCNLPPWRRISVGGPTGGI